MIDIVEIAGNVSIPADEFGHIIYIIGKMENEGRKIKVTLEKEKTFRDYRQVPLKSGECVLKVSIEEIHPGPQVVGVFGINADRDFLKFP